MPVRDAVLDDLENLIALSRRMHEESNFRSLSFSDPNLRQSLAGAMHRKDMFFFGIYEINNHIVGYLLGVLQKPFFTTDTIASDMMFFVDQLYRGSPAALKLWQSFRDWAREKGACEIRQGVTTGLAPERTDRFFRKIGMESTGQNYRLELRTKSV